MVVYGFGFVSYFYFDCFVNELSVFEIVILVVMIKGLFYYNLRCYFECVKECRDLVLCMLFDENEIDCF